QLLDRHQQDRAIGQWHEELGAQDSGCRRRRRARRQGDTRTGSVAGGGIEANELAVQADEDEQAVCECRLTHQVGSTLMSPLRLSFVGSKPDEVTPVPYETDSPVALKWTSGNLAGEGPLPRHLQVWTFKQGHRGAGLVNPGDPDAQLLAIGAAGLDQGG